MNGITPISASLLAQRFHTNNMLSISNSLVRLATGQRINRGADDPAGLIASENLRAALSTLETESRLLQRADHVASVAEGGLAAASDMLMEANALVVANANEAGLSPEERQANQAQIDSILATVDRIAGSTSFTGTPLLDGTASITAGGQTYDIGSAHTSDVGQVDVDGTTYSLADIASGGDLNIIDGDVAGAQQVIQAAINDFSDMRATLGSYQKYTIESGLENNRTAIINIAAANSQIRDTDYGAEMVTLNRAMVLEHASMQAMSFLNAGRRGLLDLFG